MASITLRFPLYIAVKETPDQWLGLFKTEKGVDVFRALHDLRLYQMFIPNQRLFLQCLKNFEDKGFLGVELVGDDLKCMTMTFQQVRELPFDPPCP